MHCTLQRFIFCHTGGEAFKRELVHSVAALQCRQKVLLQKAHLKENFKCIYINMCSLVMTPISRDFIKTNQSINSGNHCSVMYSTHTA